MGTRTGFHACRSLIPLALLLSLFSLMVRAAEIPSGDPSPATTRESLTELDEVLVSGAKPSRKPSEIITWLRRLVGRFNYEGYVEQYYEGTPARRQPVQGVGNCVAFGIAPGVVCGINVRWPKEIEPAGGDGPGQVSTLVPATIMYGLDADFLAVRYLQVDSRGLAEGGHAYLVGSTLTTTTPCADIPDKCLRISRIYAPPDGKVIEMQIDIERDYKRLVRFMFLLRRSSSVPADKSSGSP